MGVTAAEVAAHGRTAATLRPPSLDSRPWLVIDFFVVVNVQIRLEWSKELGTFQMVEVVSDLRRSEDAPDFLNKGRHIGSRRHTSTTSISRRRAASSSFSRASRFGDGELRRLEVVPQPSAAGPSEEFCVTRAGCLFRFPPPRTCQLSAVSAPPSALECS